MCSSNSVLRSSILLTVFFAVQYSLCNLKWPIHRWQICSQICWKSAMPWAAKCAEFYCIVSSMYSIFQTLNLLNPYAVKIYYGVLKCSEYVGQMLKRRIFSHRFKSVFSWMVNRKFLLVTHYEILVILSEIRVTNRYCTFTAYPVIIRHILDIWMSYPYKEKNLCMWALWCAGLEQWLCVRSVAI